MSAPPQMRRADKLMPDEQALVVLENGFCGRVAAIGPDGYPYCVPLLYVVMGGALYVHTARGGHLRAAVEHDARVCCGGGGPGGGGPGGRGGGGAARAGGAGAAGAGGGGAAPAPGGGGGARARGAK